MQIKSPQPSEKVFGSHFFVQVPSGVAPAGEGPYFDPSYGIWYAHQTDFENKVVAYYARPIVNNAPTNPQFTEWGVRSPSGATNMYFAYASTSTPTLQR
jgi:hypothetical protein